MYSLDCYDEIWEQESHINGCNNGPCDIGEMYQRKFGLNTPHENPLASLPDDENSPLVFIINPKTGSIETKFREDLPP